MSTHSYSLHLDSDETVRVSHATNHDAIWIDAHGIPTLGIVLGHTIPAADRRTFLLALAEAAADLADEIELRDLEDGAA